MKPRFYRKVLKNSMTILFEKRNTPVVSVALAVRTGGMHENASEKGISHFIEHLLYKGTQTRNSKQIAEEIEGKGGSLNGFTDEALTAYYCKIPSRHINVALDVLSDMIKNPLFDEKEIEKEKKVIYEEIKMNYDNPMRHIFREIQRCLYEEPFGLPLIGTEKTLSSFTKQKVTERFDKIYQPNNMILCVVGNADFKKIIEFAKDNFGNKRGKIPGFKIKEKNKSRTEKRHGIGQANLLLSYHVPKAKNKKSYAAFVLNVLMAGGMSSRLFHEIREKRNLAYGVYGDSDINKDFAHNVIYVGTTKKNISLVRKIILDEFRKVSRELTERELNKTKEHTIGNHQISEEDSQNQMINLLLHEINGDAWETYDFEKNIRKVNLKDVKALAKNTTRKHSFFALVPEK